MRGHGSVVRAVGLSLLIAIVAVPVMGAEGIDPEADRILMSMSTYMAATKAFSMNADVALEVVTKDAQKLQLTSSAALLVQRPSHFRIQVKGMVADAEFVFDGKALTLFSRKRNAYVQRAVAGTTDDAFRAYEFETGLPATGADLLFADTHAVLSEGVRSSAYLGTDYVGGFECHHLAFREDQVDWQLWVRTGDAPLPMRYVVTTKWVAGAPQFELSLRDWNTSPQILGDPFTFRPPAGARKLDTVPLEELDELPYAKEEQ